MPSLDLVLAKRIADGIVALLARWAPDVQPLPEDLAAAEFATKLRRRDVREILYLRELEAGPRWPEGLWNANDTNQERVFVRVATERTRVDWACAVFNGSLVHWEQATATVDGDVTFSLMSPDTHWGMKLEMPETVLREMGVTLIPPASMRLPFGKWPLRDLLDPRAHTVLEASRELEIMAASLLKTRGIRSRAHAYQRVLDILRLGYDPGTLAAALEGRTPTSLVELNSWMEERNPPFSWTRD